MLQQCPKRKVDAACALVQKGEEDSQPEISIIVYYSLHGKKMDTSGGSLCLSIEKRKEKKVKKK